MRLHEDIDIKKLKSEMEKFLGKIKQLPPKKSRVKRALREREVAVFEILEKDGKDVLFLADVQAGTYIRKLCSDLGENIGGAHMLELRRIKAGLFSEEDKNFVNLYDFEKAVNEYKKGNEERLREILTSGEIITEVLPVIQIRKDVVKKVLSGSPIFPNFLEKNQDEGLRKLNKDDKICIFSGEKFIGCYNYIGSDNLIAKPEFVFN